MTTVGPRLRLETVAPDDDAALCAWFDLETAAQTVDRPYDPPRCWPEHRVLLSMPRPDERTTIWLARAGGELVGRAMLDLPMRDNLCNAFADVLVAPKRRRAGIGTALLAHLATEARRAGRVRLMITTVEPAGALRVPGPAFATSVGAVPALAQQQRRLTLPPDDGALARLYDDARAAASGYELLQWTGATPSHWLDDVAELTGRMSTDVPLGALHLEPIRYDAERIRAQDARQVARGRQMFVTAAVDSVSGRLVAHTEIIVTGGVAWHGRQRNTIVALEHRGHRLGTLVKLANLALVRRERPAVRAVTTLNADANSFMVAINDAMGFRPLDRWVEWELDLPGRPGPQAGSSGAISSAAAVP